MDIFYDIFLLYVKTFNQRVFFKFLPEALKLDLFIAKFARMSGFL